MMTSSLDPLSQALADAAALHRETRADDGAMLTALRAVVDDCCSQLRALQDAAVADADQAMQRLRAARAANDAAGTTLAYRDCGQAIAHAQQVSAQVVTALEDLLTGSLALTSSSLARLQRGLDATRSLIAHAESVTGGTASD